MALPIKPTVHPHLRQEVYASTRLSTPNSFPLNHPALHRSPYGSDQRKKICIWLVLQGAGIPALCRPELSLSLQSTCDSFQSQRVMTWEIIELSFLQCPVKPEAETQKKQKRLEVGLSAHCLPKHVPAVDSFQRMRHLCKYVSKPTRQAGCTNSICSLSDSALRVYTGCLLEKTSSVLTAGALLSCTMLS